MRRLVPALVCAVALAASGWAQPPQPPDPRLAKGVAQVDEGDYDGAIVTLDVLVRELAARNARSTDLAQAYLYLGVAYLAKGHETSAKARFREALGQAGDLRLSTDKFAPRVVELFEKAREETRLATAAPTPVPKRGRSKTVPILLGVVAAGGGAVALAAGGGGNPSPPPGTPPLMFNGQLSARTESAQQTVGPFAAGACEASLSWSDGRTEVRMFVVPQTPNPPPIDTRAVSNTSSIANWSCVAGTAYRIELFLQEPHLDVTYQLRVVPPQ